MRRIDLAGSAICLITLALAVAVALPNATSAADAPQASSVQAQPADEELSEIQVEGLRLRTKNPQTPLNWMARLVGEFVIDGTVDLHALGKPADLVKVQGRAECIGFGIAPGVQCDLNVRWPDTKGLHEEEIPGGVSTLNPAVMLFGFEKDQYGIYYMLVDSKGFAEKATGMLATSDTLAVRAPCGAIRGDCEHVARITATPDLKVVEMKVDQVVDHQTQVSFTFVMHRVPGSPSIVYGRKQK